jgi:hypothetical protein
VLKGISEVCDSPLIFISLLGVSQIVKVAPFRCGLLELQNNASIQIVKTKRWRFAGFLGVNLSATDRFGPSDVLLFFDPKVDNPDPERPAV